MWKGIAVAGALTLWALAATPGQQQAAQEQPRYAGAESCFVCHIDFARKWAEHSHSKELMQPERPANLRGCEACHGPGAEHVAGNRARIIKWDELKTEQQNEICLPCHDPTVQTALWEKNPHNLLELGCSSCHAVHRPMPEEPMLAKKKAELCAPCHDDAMKTAVEDKTHHPIAVEGMTLECNMCHNLHGTEHYRSLNQPQEEMCTMCHGDEVPQPDSHKQADWRQQHGKEWQKEGEKERCLTCHNEQESCNTCHAGLPMPHPEEFALKHAEVAKKTGKGCLNCHEVSYCQLCHEDLPFPAEE